MLDRTNGKYFHTCNNIVRDLEEMNTVERSVYMPNMLNGGYIVEWADIYVYIYM